MQTLERLRRGSLFPYVVAAGLVVGSCATEPSLLEEVSEREASVLNGVLESGHPTVGILDLYEGGYAVAGVILGSKLAGHCSGTLIGKRTVLTAAHCVLDSSNKLGQHFYYYQGGASGPRYYGGTAIAHPDYDDAKFESRDVAVVKLSKDVTGVTPLPLGSADPIVGEQLVLVAFGRDKPTGTFGTKRKANGSAVSMRATTLSYRTPSGAGMSCPGDSGGAVLAVRGGQELQIAVHTNGDCQSASYGMRADAFLSWIKTQAGGDLTTSAVAPVDVVTPSVKILSPQTGAVLGQSFIMDIDADDNVGVTKAVLTQDGKALGSAGSASSGYRFTLSKVPEGVHLYKVTVYDSAGLTATDSVQVTVKSGTTPPPADTVPPQVRILEPSLGAEVGASFTAKVEATDNVAVTKVVFYVDGASLGARTQAPYSFSIKDAAEGGHRLKAVAYDAAGNSSMFETKVFVEPPPIPVPKPTPPEVKFLQPSTGAVVEQSFTAQVEATDADSIREVVLYLDDSQVGSKAAPPYTFALAGVTPGPRVLRAVATDGAGDAGETSIAVTVKSSGEPIKDPGAYGAPCASSSECVSQICARDPGTGEKYCTVLCDLAREECPAGSRCETAAENAEKAVCRPALVDPGGGDPVDGSGCAVAASASGPGASWLLLGLALLSSLILRAVRGRLLLHRR